MKKKTGCRTARAITTTRRHSSRNLNNKKEVNENQLMSSTAFKSTAQFTGASGSTFRESLNQDIQIESTQISSYGLSPNSSKSLKCETNTVPTRVISPYSQIDYIPWRNAHILTTSLETELCGVRSMTYADIHSTTHNDTMRIRFTEGNFFPVKNSYIPLARNIH